MAKLWFADLGRIRYAEALNLQRRLVQRRLSGEIEDTLLLLEHEPVITLGSGGGEKNLLASHEELQRAGVELFLADRGGNITYHGPGQLVGYPIFDLRGHGRDVHCFLRNLEQVVVGCLADLGIHGEVVPGLTGVWVGQDKVCSIGIAVRKWITYHGFALNVSPNFEHWSLIRPCGLVGKKATSVERLLGRDVDMSEVKISVVAKCAEVFGLTPINMEVGSLIGEFRESPAVTVA